MAEAIRQNSESDIAVYLVLNEYQSNLKLLLCAFIVTSQRKGAINLIDHFRPEFMGRKETVQISRPHQLKLIPCEC